MLVGDFDGDGNLVITDTLNRRLLLLSESGTVSLLAGDATGEKFGCSDGPGTTACFHFPDQAAITASGDVVVWDAHMGRLAVIRAGLTPPNRAWRLGKQAKAGCMSQALFSEEHADVRFELGGQIIHAHALVRASAGRMG